MHIEGKLTAQAHIAEDPCEGWLADLSRSVETGSIRELLGARRGIQVLAEDAGCEKTRERASFTPSA